MSLKTLQDFPISAHWKPAHPDRLQLYSFPSANGVKVSVALEELGVPYEAHLVTLEQAGSPAFRSLNPNGKIPAIIDPNGPGGEALALWESGAILIYLAEQYGGLFPKSAVLKYETVQWLMFQMGGIGPMFGQYGYFSKFAGKEVEDPRPREHFRNQGRRLMGVLEARLKDRQWIMGDDYTIADIAIFPWIRSAQIRYGAGEALGFEEAPYTMVWMERCIARPASIIGLNMPPRR